MRQMNFYKRPGVAETLDWTAALLALNRKEVDEKTLEDTMGCVFKYREDIRQLKNEIKGKGLDLGQMLRELPELQT